MLFVHLLLMIIIANASPIFAQNIMGDRWSYAIDAGMKFIDGNALLGKVKTWRGVIASVIFTSIAALLLGYSPKTGMLIAVYSMSGDLISSFIKRRLKLAPSSRAILIDQIPESLLPAYMMMQVFHLDLHQLIVLIMVFIVFEIFISKILYQWGIRRRPY